MENGTQKEFLINAGQLVAAIKTLKPFMSDDSERYYLCGAYFEIEEDSQTLNMVATDGIKLCVLNAEVDRMELFDSEALSAIVSEKSLDTILAMLKGVQADMPASLRFDDKTLFVDAKDEKGEFHLIQGVYPRYREVVPKKIPKFIIGLGKAQAHAAMTAIASQGKEGLQWEMTDNYSPLVIRGENKLVLVMPMQVTLPGEPTVAVESENGELLEGDSERE